MTAVLEANGLGKRSGRRQALFDCTLSIPPGLVVGLVGPNGAGKTTLLQLAAGCCRRHPARSKSSAPARRPGRHRWPRSGSSPRTPHLRWAVRRRPSAPRRPAQPRLGRRSGGTPDRAAGPGAGSASRKTLGRSACPARPDPRDRETARAADPRRARGQPRPARPTRVPAKPDGVHRRTRRQRRALLPPGRRPGAGLRLPDRAGRLAGPEVAGEIEELLASHYRLTGAYRDPATLPAGQQVIQASHTDRQSTLIVRNTTPIDDPSWNVEQLSLEDLVLAYMAQAATTVGHMPVLEAQR